ncbi:DUF2243 domain-containing protein [Gordonia sp. NPDC127522]|uniref:DUF2243 domain-containing protein n=1 Tax=Gordonia sp. NPDC127522 TaxID=3345390 RepID=UPI003642ACD5
MNSSNRSRRRRNLAAGILLGLGAVAFLDEVVFHQLLHWHHFYDKSTSDVGLVSDGVFHAFSWFATVAAAMLLVGLARDGGFSRLTFAAGWLTGAGFFQLYDGLVQHKVMGLHQIRYGVDLTPYDLVWNIVAGVLLAAGIALWVITARRVQSSGDHTRPTGTAPSG